MKYFAPPKKIPVDAHVHIDIGIRMTLWASDRLVSPSAQNLNVAPKTFFYVRATFFLLVSVLLVSIILQFGTR